MPATRLYFEDSHLTSCEAVVTGCVPWKEGAFALTLDRTVFFPEGGGQPADRGFLQAGKKTRVAVEDVREGDGEVLHIIREPLAPGQVVTAAIDWNRRLDHIQQHTGEHILSHAVWHLFGINNLGFHLGQETVTIDLSRALTQEELEEAEDFAAGRVFANLPVRAYTAGPKELKNKRMRKTTEKFQGELRVVEVEGGDCCTCCGTHAARTGEVGLVKIIRQDSHKGGVRLSFLCGGRALLDYRRKNRTVLEAGAAFSTNEEGILPAIARLREESSATGVRLREAAARLMGYRAEELLSAAREKGEQRVLVAVEEDAAPKEARTLMNKLLETENLTVALVTAQGDTLSYFVGRSRGSDADCRFFCDMLGALLGGKGGGKEGFAQGSAKASAGWRESAHLLWDHMLR